MLIECLKSLSGAHEVSKSFYAITYAYAEQELLCHIYYDVCRAHNRCLNSVACLVNYDPHSETEILGEQDEFAGNDLCIVNNLLVEFMNIFDKGYRCIVAASL